MIFNLIIWISCGILSLILFQIVLLFGSHKFDFKAMKYDIYNVIVLLFFIKDYYSWSMLITSIIAWPFIIFLTLHYIFNKWIK